MKQQTWRKWVLPVLVAVLAVGVIICGSLWGLTSGQLGDARTEAGYWQTQADYWEDKYQSVQQPRDFNSLQELRDWLEQDDTDSYMYVIDFFDCDDFARILQKHALKDGFIISCEVDLARGHMLNTAVIGNACYKIEPQTDYVWFWLYLD